MIATVSLKIDPEQPIKTIAGYKNDILITQPRSLACGLI